MKRNCSVLLCLVLFSFNVYGIRLKYALEKFELDELAIYSTTYKESCGWRAEIVDRNNDVHSLTVGSFIGKNIGKVIKIEQGKIYIKEIMKDESGKGIEKDIVFDTLYQHPTELEKKRINDMLQDGEMQDRARSGV